MPVQAHVRFVAHPSQILDFTLHWHRHFGAAEFVVTKCSLRIGRGGFIANPHQLAAARGELVYPAPP